jgi:hypothetical protein
MEYQCKALFETSCIYLDGMVGKGAMHWEPMFEWSKTILSLNRSAIMIGHSTLKFVRQEFM